METQNGNATLASNMKMTTGDNRVMRSTIKTNLLVTDKKRVVNKSERITVLHWTCCIICKTIYCTVICF